MQANAGLQPWPPEGRGDSQPEEGDAKKENRDRALVRAGRRVYRFSVNLIHSPVVWCYDAPHLTDEQELLPALALQPVLWRLH